MDIDTEVFILAYMVFWGIIMLYAHLQRRIDRLEADMIDTNPGGAVAAEKRGRQ